MTSQASSPHCDAMAVKVLLNVHDQWESAAETRAVELFQSVQDLLTKGENSLTVFTLEELQCGQELDLTVSKIVPFVIRKRRPSRCDRARLNSKAVVFIKQWDRLQIQSGVLYHITKGPPVHKRDISLFCLTVSRKKHYMVSMMLPDTSGKREPYTWQDSASFRPRSLV